MTKPRALCLIRPQVHYRREAFLKGLEAAGFELVDRQPANIDRHDLLVIWNRYGGYEQLADAWELRGGHVCVVENGYYGKDHNGRQPYAMSLHEHQGAGRWWIEKKEPARSERFNALGINFAPFDLNRPGYVLVCGQRGIGSRKMKSPPYWEGNMAKQIREATGLEVRIRPHPELLRRQSKDPTPLHIDLGGARAVVVWSSNVSVTSLAMGIPTYHNAPRQMVGINRDWEQIVSPKFDANWWAEKRLRRFTNMAWAQWFVDEISTGKPFELLQRLF